MRAHAFNPLLALATLLRRRVRFVVIGGFAGRLWGSPTLTNDLDICYANGAENLEALSLALPDLQAHLRGADLRFPLLPESLRAGDHFTFVTRAGNLDCLGIPWGSAGYDALEGAATEMDLGGVRARIAALEDLIRMKRAANLPKDLIEVEVLGALQEEVERLERDRKKAAGRRGGARRDRPRDRR